MFRNSLILLSVLYFVNLGNTLELRQPGLWQDLPIHCYNCTGDECKVAPSEKTQHGPCATDNLSTCYTVFRNNSVIARGCKADVLKAVGDYCTKNSSQCFECTSNLCNIATKIEEYQDCYMCNSDTDPSCVSITNTTTVPTTKCYKSCMTAIYPQTSGENPRYELVRSCLDDMELQDQAECMKPGSTVCSSCTGAKCNANIFPGDRLICQKCNVDQGNCNVPKPEPCAVYEKFDQCAYRYSGTQLKSLGCKSDFARDVIRDMVQQNEVFFCDAESCNSLSTAPKTQTCTTCNSLTDVNCAVQPDAVKEMGTCSNFPNTQCFSKVKGGHVERGCVSSLEDNDRVSCILGELDGCKVCYGGNCNNKVYPAGRRQCHRCNSKDNKDCEEHPKSSQVCPKYVEGDSCIVWNNNGTIVRDCASETTCDGTDVKHCVICLTDNCNDKPLKNSGSKPVANLLVTSLFVGIVSFLIKY